MDIDSIRLNFSPESLQVLNIALAVIMFGVALDIHLNDFKTVLKSPKAPLIGLLCQFLLLPALASLLILILQPQPSMALGLMLVAACPGGNFSNFLTQFAGGSAALSVTMSSVSTVLSIVMTPLNLSFWGWLNPHTSHMLQEIKLSAGEILQTVVLILILPLLLGMGVNHWKPTLAQKLHKGLQAFSLIFLVTFIGLALKNNFEYFVRFIGLAAWIVFLTNGAALLMGYWFARGLKLSEPDARAVAFEVGIQNAGFGLILVFNFFNGLGGMAIIAAWWGVWHLISGLGLALWWRRQHRQSEPLAAEPVL